MRLRHLLDRHEVQDEQPQRTDVLTVRARRVHDEDVLPLENIRSGQIVGYFNRHIFPFPWTLANLIARDPRAVAVSKGTQADEPALLGCVAIDHAVRPLIAVIECLPAPLR